ncbi:Efflux pump FUS6-like protein [Cladobotryum mycophilum]|uniref:Efflux pump FUS6-like protein n=1 Tax=Cladobotryum mycophilum TaxID=491253 RepID=A0ABR0SVE6_9HYPO
MSDTASKQETLVGTIPDDVENQIQEVSKRPKYYNIIIASLCSCVFIDTVNTINFAAALPAVATDLNATTTQAFWCGTVLLFAQCVAQPIYGALAESFGRKSCMLTALAIFTLGSLLAALAQTIEWLIAVRAVQGLGGGGINVCVNLIVVDLSSRSERAKLSGIVALAGALGLAAGVLSGAATTGVTWRLIFYINLPIACIPFVLLLLFLPRSNDKINTLSIAKSMDWTGIVILSGSVAAILFAIISGGTQFAWSSANIISPLVIGVVGIFGFGLFEEQVAGKYGFGQAFIPLRLFASRTAAFGYLMSFLQAVILWTISYYFQLYMHISDSLSLLESSIHILPSTLIVPPSAAIAGILMSKFNHFKYFNLAAFVLIAAGCAALSTLRADASTAKMIGFQILYSIGGGILFPGRLVAVQMAQREMSEDGKDDGADVRMATSLVSLTTSMGEAFGIAMGSTTLQGAWNPLVRKAVADGRIPEMFILSGALAARSAELIKDFPEPVAQVYREIAALSIARIWYICVGMAGLGIIAAILSKNIAFNKAEESGEK